MDQAFAGFKRTEVAGVPVLWLPDTRFKTFCIHLSARRTLDERAAARSILPVLLMQGTANYPDRPALARRMESLYGAMVAPGSSKEGEVHVLRFGLDCVAGDYLPDRPDQLADGLDFLAEFLAHPRLDGDGFPDEIFAREQRQAVHDARSVFDDRGAYAAQQSLTRACEGEPMSIPEHGGVAAIEAMDRATPEQARQDFLQRGELLVMGMGALPDDEQFLERVAGFLDHLPDRQPEQVLKSIQREVQARRSSVERVDLQQSKMVLIFRLPMTDDPKVWMGRAIFSNMLGGGPHSRLFREVREKRSLAYYAQAVLDRHKGLLTVNVGLDETAGTAVEEETLRQSAALASGDFTTEELATARAGILSSITSLTDTVRSHVRFVEDQWNLGLDRTPADLFESYEGVTAEQVASSVEGMQLDYSYLLAPSEVPAPSEPEIAR
jgi:predicted Zn-dependent peptidase